MPAIKSPALLKAEALARVGSFVTNIQNAVAHANKLLADGVPANTQTGAPALTAAEVADVVGADVVAFVQGAAALIPAPTAPAAE